MSTAPPLPDISETVRARMAQRLQAAPEAFLLTDEYPPSDKDASPRKKKRTMKSGMLRTQDTHVVIRITWPHEVVKSAVSRAPVYEELSLAAFTNGYLGIVAEEKGSAVGEVMLVHLRALLQDVDVYGWRVVRDYHAAWLQLLEQGWATWMDEGERTELRRLMVWSKPSLTSKSNTPPAQTTSMGFQHSFYVNHGRWGKTNYVPHMAKTGDRACFAYNRGSCQSQSAHPADQHVCTYCLRVAQQLCRHPEGRCNWKAAAAKNGDGGV